MTLATFTMRQLLEAGVHYGHTTRRWNPKMKPYIYGTKDGIHIINLDETAVVLSRSLEAVKTVVAKGGRVLFVGTKRQSADLVAAAAARCGQYYVNYRWLGGMLTNWSTVSKSINYLRSIEKRIETEAAVITKKELLGLKKEQEKLQKVLGGIRDMGGTPDLIFVIDTNKEHIAIKEARNLDIPVVAIVDTNSDPDGITYPVPGNDDATRAIALYCDLIADAVLDGLKAEITDKGGDLGASVDLDDEVVTASSKNQRPRLSNTQVPVTPEETSNS